MQYDTAGNPRFFFDMCAYCNLDTGGNHQLWCPLYPKPTTDIIDCAYKESYPEFVKRKKAEIDAHPEWGIKYL